jgi:hypothetical protein
MVPLALVLLPLPRNKDGVVAGVRRCCCCCCCCCEDKRDPDEVDRETGRVPGDSREIGRDGRAPVDSSSDDKSILEDGICCCCCCCRSDKGSDSSEEDGPNSADEGISTSVS